jgi:hypothetical protein
VIKIIVFDVNNFHSVGEFDSDDFFSLNTLVNGDQVQFRFFFYSIHFDFVLTILGQSGGMLFSRCF